MTARSTDDLLAEARGRIRRFEPDELGELESHGALVVDIRPAAQRAAEGELGFGLIVERNVLEWRFDLTGSHTLPQVTGYDQPVVVVCSEGYASSLAADSLRALGFGAAGDLAGGYQAWRRWRDGAAQACCPRHHRVGRRGISTGAPAVSPWTAAPANGSCTRVGAPHTDGDRVTTISADLAPGTVERPVTRRRVLRVSPGTLGIAAATGLVLFEAVDALVDAHGLGSTLADGWAQLVAPAFVALVLAAVVCERLWPAERRPFLARGHVQDASYFLLYVVAIAPFMTLLSVGSAVILRGHASWLQANWTARWPLWAVVVATLLAMDLCNWLAHLADHRIGALWGIHALHHSQEELSVLTSFRAHPLMHTNGFLLATVPVLLITGAHPLAPVLITIYVCLGTLPHTNVRWSYGPLGWVFVSPAYHRLHHAVEGRQGANLGVVLTVWDMVAGMARFPVKGAVPCATGLEGRPVIVEQADRETGRGAPGRLMARQLAQPFTAG